MTLKTKSISLIVGLPQNSGMGHEHSLFKFLARARNNKNIAIVGELVCVLNATNHLFVANPFEVFYAEELYFITRIGTIRK
jgi:hypothetical protein